jgi:hypothetical protein
LYVGTLCLSKHIGWIYFGLVGQSTKRAENSGAERRW